MYRYLFLLGSVSISALSLPGFVERNPDLFNRLQTQVSDYGEVKQAERAVVAQQQASVHGRERIWPDQSGHYFADFRMNGRTARAVIDTGATLISMNESTARRLGIRVGPQDYIYRVRTANGETRAARAIIGEVRLGSIVMRDVEASVLEDRALDVVLVGMSFLKRLRKVQVENGRLELIL